MVQLISHLEEELKELEECFVELWIARIQKVHIHRGGLMTSSEIKPTPSCKACRASVFNLPRQHMPQGIASLSL